MSQPEKAAPSQESVGKRSIKPSKKALENPAVIASLQGKTVSGPPSADNRDPKIIAPTSKNSESAQETASSSPIPISPEASTTPLHAPPAASISPAPNRNSCSLIFSITTEATGLDHRGEIVEYILAAGVRPRAVAETNGYHKLSFGASFSSAQEVEKIVAAIHTNPKCANGKARISYQRLTMGVPHKILSPAVFEYPEELQKALKALLQHTRGENFLSLDFPIQHYSSGFSAPSNPVLYCRRALTADDKDLSFSIGSDTFSLQIPLKDKKGKKKSIRRAPVPSSSPNSSGSTSDSMPVSSSEAATQLPEAANVAAVPPTTSPTADNPPTSSSAQLPAPAAPQAPTLSLTPYRDAISHPRSNKAGGQSGSKSDQDRPP